MMAAKTVIYSPLSPLGMLLWWCGAERSSIDCRMVPILVSTVLCIWLWWWSGLPALPPLEVLLPSPTSLTIPEPPFRLLRLDWLSIELLDPAPFLSSSNMRMISFSSAFSRRTFSWLTSSSLSFLLIGAHILPHGAGRNLPNLCHSRDSFLPFCRSSSRKQQSSLSSWLSSCSFWLISLRLRISWRCTLQSAVDVLHHVPMF